MNTSNLLKRCRGALPKYADCMQENQLNSAAIYFEKELVSYCECSQLKYKEPEQNLICLKFWSNLVN